MRMHIWRSSSIRERLNKSKDHPWALGAALTVLLFIGAAVGVMLGSSGLGAWEIARALLDGDTASKAYRIVAYARAPRVLGAILAPAALLQRAARFYRRYFKMRLQGRTLSASIPERALARCLWRRFSRSMRI